MADRKEEKKFNIFEHILVPKHEVMNDEEVEELLSKYRIKAYQLPYIKSSDPCAKAVNAQPGQVLKITRRGPAGSESTAYRYVIEG